MPSSALPRTTELRQEDDWTNVKDPKEKKRIQNRVAQRTYRHRMKARLGELQTRLESYEARRSRSAEASDTATLPSTSITTPDSCPSPAAVAITGKSDRLAQQPLPPNFRQQPSLCEKPIDDLNYSFFPQIAPHSMFNNPPTLQPYPAGPALLSSPTQADQRQDSRAGKNSQDFMDHCLRFQLQMLSVLNTLEQDTGCTVYRNATGQTTTADQVNCVPTVTNTERMDFVTTNNSFDIRKSDGINMLQASPNSTYYSNITSVGSSASMAAKPSQNATLNERFQYIMKQVDAAGFESFHAMATAYYTQILNDTSPFEFPATNSSASSASV